MAPSPTLSPQPPVRRNALEPAPEVPYVPLRERAPTRVPTRPELVFTPFLAESDMALSLVDPSLPDQPLVHVNDAFCALSGYEREECIGRNCRFLQGRLTRDSEVAAIRTGIATERFVLTRLLNYRRDGRFFDNALQLGQLRDVRGEVRFLFGLQWDVTETLKRLDDCAEEDLRDRTLSSRLRALERMARHLVRRSIALGEGAAGVPLVERLVAMSRPYQFPTPDPRPDRATLHALFAYLIRPYAHLAGERVRFDGAPGSFDAALAGTLALWIHEIAIATANVDTANGAEASARRRVVLSWGFPTERGRRMIAFNWNLSAVDDAPEARHFRPFLPANRGGGNGARIMREVVEFAGGRSITRTWEGSIDATLLLPND